MLVQVLAVFGAVFITLIVWCVLILVRTTIIDNILEDVYENFGRHSDRIDELEKQLFKRKGK